MSERMINIIKWAFMIMGGMFLIEMFLLIGAFIALVKYANTDSSFLESGFDEIIYKITDMP